MPRPDARYSLVVFDFDGTLIDSTATIAECIQEAARDAGLPVPDKARASHVIGLGLQDSLRYAVPELKPEGYAAFVDGYRRHFLARQDSMSLFDGVRELLDELHAGGYRMAIATGKSRRGLDRSMDALDLRRYMCATRCADETDPKPHPAMLLELMDETNLPAARLLMIGDTSHDIGMAKAAGVDAVAVTYGAHDCDSLRALSPRACVDSVEELRQWLKTNG
jgi:phosphoglycolate phosphatase